MVTDWYQLITNLDKSYLFWNKAVLNLRTGVIKNRWNFITIDPKRVFIGLFADIQNIEITAKAVFFPSPYTGYTAGNIVDPF